MQVCHFRVWFTLPLYPTSPQIRMSKIGRAPNLQNEYKHGRWNLSVLDGSSPSADSRKKVNHKRIINWKETINIIISEVIYEMFHILTYGF